MTAEEYFKEELSGEPLTQESVIEGLKEFAKMWARTSYKEGLLDFEDLDRSFDPSDRKEATQEYLENFINGINI